MNDCTYLTPKNRTLIIDLIDREISSIDSLLLKHKNYEDNYNILAYSRAVYLTSDNDSFVLN